MLIDFEQFCLQLLELSNKNGPQLLTTIYQVKKYL